MRIVKIETVIETNERHGLHWFGGSEMRFFATELCPHAVKFKNGYYFVSSEKYGERALRKYSLRFCRNNGEIDTIGDFMGFATKDGAWDYLVELHPELQEVVDDII